MRRQRRRLVAVVFMALYLSFPSGVDAATSATSMPELRDGQNYRGEEAVGAGSALLVFRKQGASVVGTGGTPYWAICFHGTLSGNKIHVKDVVFQHTPARSQESTFEPVGDDYRKRFAVIHVIGVEPFPNPRALLPTPQWVVERDERELNQCAEYFGRPRATGPGPAPTPDDCVAGEEPRRRPLDLRAENREWIFIREVIDDYAAHVSPLGEHDALAIFAHQLQNLVDLAMDGREESAGAWSGELARQSLLFIAKDLQANPDFGVDVGQGKGCDSGRLEVPYCRVQLLGDRHLDRHVRAFFQEFGKKALSEAVARPCPTDAHERIARELGRIRNAHLLFVANAVLPGFLKVEELIPIEAVYAGFDVQGKALRARQLGLAEALNGMATSGIIDRALADRVTKAYLHDASTDLMLPSVSGYDDGE